MTASRRPQHLRAVPASPTPAPRELSGELARDAFPLIPAGDYVAAYVGAEDVEQYKGFKRYLWFEILALDSERTPYDGLRLPLICPMVSKGRCSPHGKYANLWSRVTGRRPSRADRLTTTVFRGRLFRVRVRTVVADHNQRSLARINQYSVVDGVVNVEAGGPLA